jgi:CheY-like chemotaxis protein
MMKEQPIIIIEDDSEDQELILEILRDLNVTNQLQTFSRCEHALVYLEEQKNQPFLIICDINVPGMKGIEFKKHLDRDPQTRLKSIPFVFLSTAAETKIVNEAYDNLSIQGFFKKPTRISDLKQILQLVIEYWRISMRPSTLSNV